MPPLRRFGIRPCPRVSRPAPFEPFAGAGRPTLVEPDSVVIAILFAAAVGIGFGLYPARKAAKLDPTEALRYGSDVRLEG